MGLSRTVSEINGDFGRKSQIFPAPVYFVPRFPLELGIGAGDQKTRVMGLPGRQRSLTISSAVWIECTNVTDGRSDGQTAGDISFPQLAAFCQQFIKEMCYMLCYVLPRLRIASRGNYAMQRVSLSQNMIPCEKLTPLLT